MSSYALGTTSDQKLVITFSHPSVANSSSSLFKLQATMTITGGDPPPGHPITLIGYANSAGTSPIADGLDITGNSVSQLTLKLKDWPSHRYTITASWTDGSGNQQATLSTSSTAITIPSGGTSPFAISIELDFEGNKSGDPKIKVIPPT